VGRIANPPYQAIRRRSPGAQKEREGDEWQVRSLLGGKAWPGWQVFLKHSAKINGSAPHACEKKTDRLACACSAELRHSVWLLVPVGLRMIHRTLPTTFGARKEAAMRTKGANGAGRFSVEIEVTNYADLIRAQDGTLPAERVRRETILGVVDSGATKLVLPEAVVTRLGLQLGGKVKVRYADGRRVQRREAEGAYVKLLGRHDTFSAIVEPRRETALIGAMVLEGLDLVVECITQRVVPRDPRGAIYEIE
jgi:predicted aspartyl protease